MSQPIGARDGHLVFQIVSKNTNLVEDIEILLPVKFRWILLSGFRGEVKNVKVNDGRTDGRRTMYAFGSGALKINVNFSVSWPVVLSSKHVSIILLRKYDIISQLCHSYAKGPFCVVRLIWLCTRTGEVNVKVTDKGPISVHLIKSYICMQGMEPALTKRIEKKLKRRG